MLGGTDLVLAFNEKDAGFPIVDCRTEIGPKRLWRLTGGPHGLWLTYPSGDPQTAVHGHL